MGQNLPSKDALAREFSQVLLEWLGAEQFAEVVALNAKETNSLVCHSQDFCDANMAMDAAFSRLGFDPLPDLEKGMSDEVLALWNDAWDLAKANGFYLSGE